MNFASDTVAGVADPIMRALLEGMTGTQPSYGYDPISAELEPLVGELFECQVMVLPVTSGGAANGLALSAMAPPYGGIFCHEEAHVAVDECGAPEFFTSGAKLITVPGDEGKIDPDALKQAIDRTGFRGIHGVKAAALSITQLTECGTAYKPDEIAALTDIAKRHNMAIHMDGARFANAAASLGQSPADLTWRAGIDMLSLGATKNGCLMAEAVVVFNPTEDQRADLAYRRKRAGQLLSKHRVLALQWRAYLSDGLWLDLASHANAQAAALASGLARLPDVTLIHPVEGNEVFIDWPDLVADALLAEGVGMGRWPDGGWRLVTAFNTDPGDVERLVSLAAKAVAEAG